MSPEPTDKTLADPELLKCPKCGEKMNRWYTPLSLSWGTPYQYVCFNDDCPYYVRGWKWMEERYNKKASYRNRYNPFDGESGPVPVWSPGALRARIMGDDESAEDYLRRTGSLKDEEGNPIRSV